MDTGADVTHPALAGRVYPVLDVVGPDVYEGDRGRVDFTGRDGNGHGTHVAGGGRGGARGSAVRGGAGEGHPPTGGASSARSRGATRTTRASGCGS